MININCNEKKLFIDGSYFIFYRYYAALNWYKRQDEGEQDTSKIMDDEFFVEKYSKFFERTLLDLKKKYKVEWNNIYFVKDCPREEIFRNKLFEGYKLRPELKSFNRDIFKYTYKILLPKLIKDYSFCSLIGKELEADDVIAILTKEIRRYNKDTIIIIITNDNDYLQLHDNVTLIYNLQDKEVEDLLSESNNIEQYITN